MKKVIVGAGIIIILLIAWQWKLVLYGIAQGRGQLSILWKARPIEEVMQDAAVPDSLKQKIAIVQEVRAFAIDSLGVNDSDSYQSLYDQQGKPVLWVVTACEPFSLQDKKWSFPLIGTFSYKGFFDEAKAKELRNQLISEGYDTGIRTVNAWSTLGFFDDPIMSNLLFRAEGSVANTSIHELTHATIFVKDDLKFNENLASFVGDKGAEAFLRYKYGERSVPYRAYDDYRTDRKKYTEHMLRGTQQLDSLYQAIATYTDSTRKAQQKEIVIQKILTKADTLTLRSSRYQRLRIKLQRQKALPNNTFFKSFVRYQGQSDSLEAEFRVKYNSDIKKYLTYLKSKFGNAL